jgi:hypothetical protein
MPSPSYEELSKALNDHPENADQLLDKFIAENGLQSEVRELHTLFSQLRRFQKIFAGIRNNLQDNPDLVPLLYHCGASLDKAVGSFGVLVMKIRDI